MLTLAQTRPLCIQTQEQTLCGLSAGWVLPAQSGMCHALLMQYVTLCNS